MMAIVKTLMVIPAVASTIFLADGAKTVAPEETIAVSSTGYQVKTIEDLVIEQSSQGNLNANSLGTETLRVQLMEDQATNRQLRVERLLIALDRVAEVALQMNPDQSAWIEPVLVDLAEQTLDLSSDEAARDASTDAALGSLEVTVEKLVHAVSRVVEPEISL